MKKDVRFVLVTLMVTTLLAELVIRVTGIKDTQFEKANGVYQSLYGETYVNWFHTHGINSGYEYDTPEFYYVNRSNDLGHRETSFAEFKADTTRLRVVCLGDSFTEGDGAPYDSSWVRMAETDLRVRFNNEVNFYNAGVCGSDVFFNAQMLFGRLIDASPDFVIEAVSLSDVYDIILRGGEERFRPDGTVRFKSGPKWEGLYEHLYVFRAIIGFFYDESLISKSRYSDYADAAAVKIGERLCATATKCDSLNIPYMVIVHPVPFGGRSADREDVRFERILESVTHSIEMVNLRDEIDLDNNPHLYWPENRHYNSKGYLKMGLKVSEKLTERFPNIFNPDSLKR